MSEPAPSHETAHEPTHEPTRVPGARAALVVLTAMNLLNYLDRYVPSAVKELFKADLDMSDAETSLPLTAFIVVYMIASPIFGAMADTWPRRGIIAAGVALWSLATGLGAFATGFWTFLLARALVGVGEAAYATLSPALLSDFYPPTRRNRALTVFYAAIPVGAAMGFVIGGLLGEAFGWRVALMAVGFPGLLAALAILKVPEPERGRFDPPEERAQGSAKVTWAEAVGALRRNRAYVVAVGGYVLVTFASGALADWFPSFLVRYRGMSVGEAGSIAGQATVLGGLGGTLLGGWLGDRLAGHTRRPYLAVSAVTMVLAAGAAVAALLVEGTAAIFTAIVAAQLLLWCYNGPINAVLVNCVGARLRARAFALSILLIHLLGDAISPPLVGALADHGWGLANAMTLVPVTMLAGAVVWWVGWRRLPVSST